MKRSLMITALVLSFSGVAFAKKNKGTTPNPVATAEQQTAIFEEANTVQYKELIEKNYGTQCAWAAKKSGLMVELEWNVITDAAGNDAVSTLNDLKYSAKFECANSYKVKVKGYLNSKTKVITAGTFEMDIWDNPEKN